MKLVYSPRAIRDLERIAAYYNSVASPKVTTAISQRIEQVIKRIALRPLTAPAVAERRNIRVVLVRRYPYRSPSHSSHGPTSVDRRVKGHRHLLRVAFMAAH